VHPIRTAALALALVLAAGEAAQAQRVQQVSPPTPRRLASPARAAAQQCSPYAAPSSVRSQGGTLSTELVMAPGTFRIGDSTYTRNIFNGQYVAPVLRMNPAEQLRVNVRNAMRPVGNQTQAQIDTTNNHYHGMIVTPLPPRGDNVTNVHIRQGGSNLNDFAVPPYQSQGMMWYHPHPHGRTAAQVSGGLAGALIIGDLLASYPDFRGATERVMYIKDTSNGKAVLNVNGSPCALLTIRPGERQLWRIGNMTGGTWLNLKLGEMGRNYRFIVLAWDGNHLTRPTLMDSLFVAPGSRVEAIVIGGTGVWGGARFYSDSIPASFNQATGRLTRTNPRADLGWLITEGAPEPVTERMMSPQTIPEEPALVDSIRRLVAETDVDTFTLRYQIVPGGLGLNGKLYSPTRLDRAVAVGRTQEWTLINETTFLHTFHIHQTDFVVTRINGVPQPDSVHLDNVHLGIHKLPSGRWAPDTVVIRFKFNQIAAGPFVYHCHDLFHEDAGMMANICVFDPARGQTPGTCRQWFPGGADAAHAHGGTPPASAVVHPAAGHVASPRRE
jgi:suppressor of ftsI